MGNSIPMTAKQSEAVTSIGESVFVAAGAGTGKTRVLVNRYLELLRTRRANVYRIAAVTYTEKAAKEMKDRIRQACREHELAGTDAETRRFWYTQRIALENGYIGTIHSLCGSILRLCPVEVGIDPLFVILDETQSTLLRRKVIDIALTTLLDEENVDAIELMRLFGREGLAQRIGGLLQNRVRALAASRRVAGDAERLAHDVVSFIEEENQRASRRVLENPEFETVFSTLSRASASDVADKLEQERRRLLALKERLSTVDAPGEALVLLKEMAGGARGRLGLKGNWDEGDLEEVRQAVKTMAGLVKELPDPLGEADRVRLDQELAMSRRLASVFLYVDSSYDRAKAESGVLDFDDLLMKTREFLISNTGGRRRLQEKFDFLLVDELQDTSFLERDIICLLSASEADSGDPERMRPVPGKLFVVGDDKQSIYGFRGSEVAVFGDFRKRILGSGKVVELDRNFRTTLEGVTFANQFFERLMPAGPDRLPFETTYLPLKAARLSGGPFAELLVAPLAEEALMAARRSEEAALIADRIERMVRDGELLVERPEGLSSPVRYGDVAILFRALTSARTYEEALRDAGIPYYLVAGSGFYAAQEVRDVLNCLKTLERQGDALALFGTLRSPMFGLSDEVLYLMSQSGSIAGAMENPDRVEGLSELERNQLKRSAAVLNDLRRRRNGFGLARLVQEVIERTGLDAVVLGQFMGHQKLANLEKLIDQARSFESSSHFTLDDFIEYMDEFVRGEARESQRAAEEEEENVVRLMSIHRAKGLEFPVVFVADMSRRDPSHTNSLLVHPELGLAVKTRETDSDDPGPLFSFLKTHQKQRESAEDLRLLYVALTRARDRVFLCGSVAGGKPESGSWLDLIFEILGVEELKNGERIDFAPDSEITVRTEPTGAVVSQESEAAQAGWLGARRLEKFDGGADGRGGLPEALGVRVGSLQPSFLRLRRFTVTELLSYRACPKQYHFERVLGLPHEIRLGPARDSGRLGTLIGTVVHRVLALWDLADGARLPNLVERAVSELADASRRQSRIIHDEALRILSRGVENGLFQSLGTGTRHLTETPFLLKLGDDIVEGKIDHLLVFEDGSCEVTDYKTNRVSAEEVDHAADAYRFQVGVYALAASRAVGPVRRGSILFLSPGKWIRWELTVAALRTISEELTGSIRAIQAGRFEARAGHCGRCGHRSICRERQGTPAGQAQLLEP